MSFREHALFKAIARPAVFFLLMAVLFMVLFPNWGPRDLSLDLRLPPPACASDVTISAFSDGVLAHSVKLPVSDRASVEWVLSLPRAQYRVEAELGCSDGRGFNVAQKTVDLHDHAELSFDLSRPCPCGSR